MRNNDKKRKPVPSSFLRQMAAEETRDDLGTNTDKKENSSESSQVVTEKEIVQAPIIKEEIPKIEKSNSKQTPAPKKRQEKKTVSYTETAKLNDVVSLGIFYLAKKEKKSKQELIHEILLKALKKEKESLKGLIDFNDI